MVTSHMNTAQELLTGPLPQKGYQQDALFAGDKVPPFPFFIENPADLHRADLPTNKNNTNQFASDDQVVERQKGVPITPLLAHEKVSLDTNPLPERCQFTFSDGRQCRMARSEIHPSRCRFHAEREEQLFGDPVSGGNVVGAALDLPELFSACRDLTTAAGVNRALGQVFRLLAQRRISRQEAATFGHLAQLLLRSISAMRALAGESPAANVYPLAGESHGHQELSPDNKVAAPADQESPQIEQPSHAVLERQECVSSPAATNGRKPAPAAAINSSLQPNAPSAPAELPTTQAAPPPASTEQLPSASTPGEPNSRRMSSYENAGLKPVQNEHLQKNGPGAIAAERPPFCGRKSWASGAFARSQSRASRR